MQGGERPPALAHQRFAADRTAFAGLTLAESFDRIHTTNLWGAATSRSGLGSERNATASLAAALPSALRRLGIGSLLDAPCGDTGWIEGLGDIAYAGVDIVPAVIKRARRNRPGDYGVADLTVDPLPYADAILCRDCLVHLSFANIACAIANFRASGAMWLLTTTFVDLARNDDCDDGDWRALNLVRAPFDWSPPVTLLDEGCTEGGGGWADKMLGVWRLSDLPGT